jgi:hypothetical protein
MASTRVLRVMPIPPELGRNPRIRPESSIAKTRVGPKESPKPAEPLPKLGRLRLSRGY